MSVEPSWTRLATYKRSSKEIPSPSAVWGYSEKSATQKRALIQPHWHPDLRHQPPDLWEIRFHCLQATQSVGFFYSSSMGLRQHPIICEAFWYTNHCLYSHQDNLPIAAHVPQRCSLQEAKISPQEDEPGEKFPAGPEMGKGLFGWRVSGFCVPVE